MSLLVFAYLYATVALIVGVYVYYRGVLARPLRKEMQLEHRAVLAVAALAVGALWLLFMPALTVLWSMQLARAVEAHLPRLSLRALREVRVRS